MLMLVQAGDGAEVDHGPMLLPGRLHLECRQRNGTIFENLPGLNVLRRLGVVNSRTVGLGGFFLVVASIRLQFRI
jgi:hypothetical protein